MRKSVVKLYRGISADEFTLATEDLLTENRKTWSRIIENRANGDFSYPHDLNQAITQLHKRTRFEYQYFTDRKLIAQEYVRRVGGLLIELTVPAKDVIHYFDIEFQNFSRRKTSFEIVYRIKGSILSRHAKKWRLQVRRKTSSHI